VVLLNVDVARTLAMRYRGRGIADDDLVQTAYLGLVKAARGFDPEKSDNFLRFAIPTILGEIKRYFRDHAWVIKPPRRIQELQPQVWEASARLSRSSGRTPGSAELAADLGLTTGEIDESLAANKCFALDSLEHQTSGQDQEGLALVDQLGEVDAGYDRAEAVVALTPLCRRLSERDRRILYLRFFHEWTQARIAKELGVTQMQISGLLSRILTQLRADLGEATDDDMVSWPETVATA